MATSFGMSVTDRQFSGEPPEMLAPYAKSNLSLLFELKSTAGMSIWFRYDESVSTTEKSDVFLEVPSPSGIRGNVRTRDSFSDSLSCEMASAAGCE